MTDEFDPYREALVLEQATLWPAEFDDVDPALRRQIETRLHAQPQEAAELEYVLGTHTGFCRQITVTAADLERVRS